jgi:hypothetical protein
MTRLSLRERRISSNRDLGGGLGWGAGTKDIPGLSVYYATLATVKTYTELTSGIISHIERIGNLINWKVCMKAAHRLTP